MRTIKAFSFAISIAMFTDCGGKIGTHEVPPADAGGGNGGGGISGEGGSRPATPALDS